MYMTEPARSTLQLPTMEPPGYPTPADSFSTNSRGVLQSTTLVNGTLQQQFLHFLPDAHGLRGLSLDSQGNAWLAALASNVIYVFRPDGTQLGQFNGGGMDSPWDTAIDGEDNVWVANFGPLEPPSNFTGRLTKLWGVNAPPGHNVGDPISPPTGYTVPSAGSEVLLHTGRAVVRLWSTTRAAMLHTNDASDRGSHRSGRKHLVH